MLSRRINVVHRALDAEREALAATPLEGWGEQVVGGHRFAAYPFCTPMKWRAPARYTYRVEAPMP